MNPASPQLCDNWLFPDPFVHPWQVAAGQIDHYGHANNVAYVSQLERTAWAHSNALSLTIDDYRQLDRAMVISRHDIHYLAPAFLDEVIDCATWIVECDKRLKLARQFQFIRRNDQTVLLQARTEFVCVTLSSGRPKRMPEQFADIYGRACITR